MHAYPNWLVVSTCRCGPFSWILKLLCIAYLIKLNDLKIVSGGHNGTHMHAVGDDSL